MFGKTISRWTIALALAISVPIAAFAPINIRLGTLAPDNSPWTNALRSMGATWAKVTDNRVRLTVFAGTIPSERSAIDRMAVDGLQAATLTVSGLAEIDPAFNVFGIPFFFDSDAELQHVVQKLTPMMVDRLAKKKFHLINWGNGGWVQVFSKMPIRTIADLQKAKLYTTEGEPKMVQWYTSNGFNAIPLATGEIPKQLKLPTGAINAAPSPPVFAVALQFFKDAPYMLDVRVAPLVGATVMTDAAWGKIDAPDRDKMMEAAGVMEKQVNTQAPALDVKAIDEMKKAGLNVVTLDAAAVAQFHTAAEKLTNSMRGGIVPADVFDAAVRERDAFRKTKK